VSWNCVSSKKGLIFGFLVVESTFFEEGGEIA